MTPALLQRLRGETHRGVAMDEERRNRSKARPGSIRTGRISRLSKRTRKAKSPWTAAAIGLDSRRHFRQNSSEEDASMKTSLRLLVLLVVIAAATAPFAHAGDVSKLLGTWKGRGFEVEGSVTITFLASGDFDLSFEDKDGPIDAHGSYAADVSSMPWKLTITLNPDGTTTTARTVMALLSDHQLLIQKTQPDAPMPDKFTKDSVILDKVP